MVNMKLYLAVGGGHLAGPVVEVGRADRQAITLQQRRHAHGRLAAVAQAVESDPFGIDLRQRFQPVQDLLVLRQDEGEQRRLDRVGLAAEEAIAVLAAIGVVRREDDEAALGQPGGDSRDRPVFPSMTILRHAVAAVLADDHGPFLARLEILRQQQHAPGEHVGNTSSTTS